MQKDTVLVKVPRLTKRLYGEGGRSVCMSPGDMIAPSGHGDGLARVATTHGCGATVCQEATDHVSCAIGQAECPCHSIIGVVCSERRYKPNGRGA